MPTLYLTIQTRTVHLDNQALVITTEDESEKRHTTRILLHDISRVVVSGSPNITVPALKSLCRAKIPLALISSRGRWIGELSGIVSNNAERRIAQYRCHISGEAALLRFALPLIATKISNQRHVLRRLSNRHGRHCIFSLERLSNLRKMLLTARELNHVRGLEGFAAAEYFKALSQFFPPEIPFVERSRRPPKNAANALLSFAYSILGAEVEFSVRLHGLDPAIGFLHSLEPGRASLALDLLEPLRPSVDAFVLSLLNRKIFTEKDFYFSPEDSGTYLTDNSHRKFFEHYEKAMSRRFAFEPTGTQMNMRTILEWQIYRYLQSLADDQCPPAFFRIPQ